MAPMTGRKVTARFVDRLLILTAVVVLLFLFAQHGRSVTGGSSDMTVQCGAGPVVSMRVGVAYSCP